MAPSPPTSVLLPTVRYTPVVDELAAQIGPDDELLVVCDGHDDPVAARETDLPHGVEVIVAGEPQACSGKANAIAVGMAAARNGYIAWTDDDFHHPPDWLDRLHAGYAQHGPVSEVPVFVGRDPFSVLVEPIYALGGTFGLYVTDKVWGGAVLFHREDVDEAAFLADLRHTVSDDGLLSEHLDATSRRCSRRVEIGGTVREGLERHVRFVQILFRHQPGTTVLFVALALLGTVGGLVNPVRSALVSTLLAAVVYAYFGIHRWTVLLAYPAFLLNPLLLTYGLVRRTFVWGGRRYRWQAKFDVDVVESG